eukprot:3592123-Amphidinium_carterae.1
MLQCMLAQLALHAWRLPTAPAGSLLLNTRKTNSSQAHLRQAHLDMCTCVWCGEEKKDLEHIVNWCRCGSSPCVRLHGLLPAPPMQIVVQHEPLRDTCCRTLDRWVRSNNAHLRRCGEG